MLMPHNPLIYDEPLPSAVLLMRAGRIATAMLEGKLSRIGITAPYAAILTALRDHGPKSATDLCALTMRERANMSVLLAKLRKIGYVEESENRLDGRSHMMSLTDSGREIAEQCHQVTLEVSHLIDSFVQGASETKADLHAILRDFLAKFHSLYV